METIFKNSANSGGVYRIFNKTNGREYYGSTVHYKKRLRQHLSALKNNKHYNLFLQRDYNKCGEDVFKFEVIKIVHKEGSNKEWATARTREEQKYLDKFFDNRSKCYNGTPFAIDLGYNPWRKKRKIEMSKTMKKLYSTQERKEEAKAYAKKRWKDYSANIIITHTATGKTVIIKSSIRLWCKQNNISYKAFNLMTSGRTKSSNGWFLGRNKPTYAKHKNKKRKPLSLEHRNKIAGGTYKGVILINKITKKTFCIGANAKEDCRTYSISYSSFHKMMKGRCKSASGWFIQKHLLPNVNPQQQQQQPKE